MLPKILTEAKRTHRGARQSFTLAGLTLGAVVSASAQSSINLSGTVDAALNRVTGSIAGRSQLNSGGNSSSKFALRGREDLGGGVSAGFHLEAQIDSSTGVGTASNFNNQPSGTSAAPPGTQGVTFSRRSSVDIAGPWGTVEAGRLWSPSYETFVRYDVFGVGVGIGLNYTSGINANGIRVSNAVGYTSPAMSSISAKFMSWFGENPSNVANKSDGSGSGIVVAYESGALAGRVHYARTKFVLGDAIYKGVAASYDIGAWKFIGNVNADEQVVKQRGFNVGAIYRVGPNEFKASLAQLRTPATGANPKSNKLSIGYVYNLSKRSAIYATHSTLTNKNGAALAISGASTAANQPSRGYEMGIRHNF